MTQSIYNAFMPFGPTAVPSPLSQTSASTQAAEPLNLYQVEKHGYENLANALAHFARGAHRRDRCASASVCTSTEQAKHPVHHGRRYRMDAAKHLPSWPDGRGNTKHRQDRPGRRDVYRLLRGAKLHRWAECLLHRHASPAYRNDPSAVAGEPNISEARHAGACQVSLRSR